LTNSRDGADSPAWSPDGSVIVYVNRDKSGTHVWTIDPQGGPARQLTFGVGYQLWPDWHPSGDRIIFTSTQAGGIRNVWEIEADGAREQQLTFRSVDAGWATFSPSGDHIAFTSWVGSRPQLFVMRSDGTRVNQITSSSIGHHGPVWSPDGDRLIAMESFGSGLRGFDPDGTNPKVIPGGAGAVFLSWN